MGMWRLECEKHGISKEKLICGDYCIGAWRRIYEEDDIGCICLMRKRSKLRRREAGTTYQRGEQQEGVDVAVV
jgi:hypothetical protein